MRPHEFPRFAQNDEDGGEEMSEITARDVIAGMKDHFDEGAARGVTAAVVYQLTGEGGGTWTLRVKDGVLEVDEAIASDPAPSATIDMAAEDFVQVALGNMNPMQGFMSGKIKIQGDLLLAQRFQGFFKRP